MNTPKAPLLVGDAALRAGEDPEGEVAVTREPCGEHPRRDRLAEPRLTGEQGEAALARQLFDAPAEVLDVRRDE